MAEYFEYELVSRTLRTHRYKVLTPRKAINTVKTEYQDLGISPEQPNNPEAAKLNEAVLSERTLQQDGPQETSASQDGKTLFKRHRISLFEENDTEEINKEIEKQINSDGYYDEILPYDYGKEFMSERKKKAPVLIFIIAGIMLVIAVIILVYNFRRLSL